MRKLEQLGPYTLLQEDGVFPLGEDALALGAFATLKKGWHVCDLGTGSGCLLLMLAGREPSLSLDGVERDPRAAQIPLILPRVLGEMAEGRVWRRRTA